MNNILTVNYNNKPIYDIIIDDNFNNLNIKLQNADLSARRVCIVSDSNVSLLYLNKVTQIVKNHSSSVESFVFKAGENSKNLGTVSKLYEKLIISQFDRNDVLIALGGGVVGDLTGYAAATYLRGIRFIQLPTSLLAMVDSSIGGKTGVDFNSYKNMVGAFYQPMFVYMALDTLRTLNDTQFNSGLGEIIKHGLIKNLDYYIWLQDNRDKIANKDTAIIREMIYQSCNIKREVVEKDPTEKGDRALLNFGHTLGHSIEKLMGLTILHGECVSIGIVAASYISYKRDFITKNEYDKIVETLVNFKLPVTISKLNVEDIIKTTKNDKKMSAGKISFILLNKIGKAVIDVNVTDEEMTDAINFITC